MRIVIVGPGALGCLLASIIFKGKEAADTVCLLDYNRDRAQTINARGVIYQSSSSQQNLAIQVHSDPSGIGPADVVFLCVKSYDVEKTLSFSAPLLGPDTLLIFMQNGIAHLPFDSISGKTATAFGTTTEGATNLGPGQICHAGVGSTYIGFLGEAQLHHKQLLENVISRIKANGTKAYYSKNILNRIWAKLFINIGINALTVIHNCKNGELVDHPEARQQMKEALAEAQAAATAEGISITSSLEDILAVCRATAGNVSSMLQDIRKGRRTEIDAINGALVSIAESHNIPTPMNSYLVKQVKETEPTHKNYANTTT